MSLLMYTLLRRRGPHSAHLTTQTTCLLFARLTLSYNSAFICLRNRYNIKVIFSICPFLFVLIWIESSSDNHFNFLKKYLLCKYTKGKNISWLLYCFCSGVLKHLTVSQHLFISPWKCYYCTPRLKISIVWFYNLACFGMFLTGYVVLVNVKLP